MYVSENAELALSLIAGDRQAEYGYPWDNLGDIADVWSAYTTRALEHHKFLTATDVANMMILAKVLRQVRGYHKDSSIDIMGYAALAEVFNEDTAKASFKKEVGLP
jgi:hypothetical protein